MTPQATTGDESPADPLAVIAGHDLEDDAMGASQRAYEAIRSAIIRGSLEPGTVLGEAELAATLGISRTPVRTALQSLQSEDLVESGPRRQILVRGVTAEQRREVLLLREALERVAVEQAAELMDTAELDELRLLLIRQRRAAREAEAEAFIDLDDQFHLRIARGARLPMLERFLGQIKAITRLMGLRAVTRSGRLDQVLAEHERIVDALEARDPAAAVAAMLDHLENTADILNVLESKD